MGSVVTVPAQADARSRLVAIGARAGEAGSANSAPPRKCVVDCSLGTALANLVPFSRP